MVTSAELSVLGRIEPELDQLRTTLQPVAVHSGANLFEQGDAGDRLVLITAGRARSSILLPSGEEQVLSVSGPGDVLGEISLLTGARRTATVTALTPLRGWTLDRHGFDALRWDPRDAAVGLVRRLVSLTGSRLRATCRDVKASLPDTVAAPTASVEPLRRSAAMPSLEYLASLLCFSGFPGIEDVAAVIEPVSVRFAERGEILISEGARPPALLLVARGAVEVMVRQGAASRRVRLAGPGRFVGQNGALDDEPSPVVARCRERSLLLAFPRGSVSAFLGDPSRPSRAFSAALLEDTARAVRQASRPVLATAVRG